MWRYIFALIIVINLILAVFIVFFQRREPKTVWAWLLVLYFLPVVGFVLYLFAGRNFYRERRFRNKELEDRLQTETCRQEDKIINNSFGLEGEELSAYGDLIMFNLRACTAFYTDDNRIKLYTDGNRKFDGLIKDMEKAEKFIFLQYYIIRDDIVFERMCRVLRKKIAEGVDVRIMFDGMGGSTVKKSFWRGLRAEGFHVCEFYPPLGRKVNFRVNYRNHRKIAVIDGKAAWIGGFNVGKEYIGLDKKFGYWRDTHLRIDGGAVQGLMLRFLLDWNYESEEKLAYEDYIVRGRRGEGFRGAGIQIISSGPDSEYEQIRDNYLKIINKAKKNIYIQTPYFIPDESVINALRIAAMSDVEVKIMIPCKPDHPFVYWATYSFAGDLLRHGVKCYLYRNGFLHSKVITADGMFCSVGTANMDMRSFKYNFEVNAVIYDRNVTEELEKIFLKDIGRSEELTKYAYDERGVGIRLKEQVSRLLSPLL